MSGWRASRSSASRAPTSSSSARASPRSTGKRRSPRSTRASTARGKELGATVDARQTNHEGTIVDWIGAAPRERFAGLLLNPGAYTHTSIAIYDALRAVAPPLRRSPPVEPRRARGLPPRARGSRARASDASRASAATATCSRSRASCAYLVACATAGRARLDVRPRPGLLRGLLMCRATHGPREAAARSSTCSPRRTSPSSSTRTGGARVASSRGGQRRDRRRPARRRHSVAPPLAAAAAARRRRRPSGDIVDVTSPFVGSFYRSPSPDAPAFVEVGSVVRPGRRSASSRR